MQCKSIGRYEIRYGDIHSVSLFGHPVVVLSSLAAVKEFRAASPENFSHRWTLDKYCQNISRQGGLQRVGIKIENDESLGFHL